MKFFSRNISAGHIGADGVWDRGSAIGRVPLCPRSRRVLVCRGIRAVAGAVEAC